MFIVLLTGQIKAAKIDKAFEALESSQFVDAHALFYESLSKELIAAPYGLSLLYGRNNNPFHNFDSAYFYISLAEQNYGKEDLSDRDKRKLLEYHADSLSIQQWKDSLDLRVYQKVKALAKVEEYQHYIDLHRDSEFRDKAIFKRDSIAMSIANRADTSVVYAAFVRNYPNSSFFEAAKKKMHQKRFEESIRDSTVEAYETYLKNNPKSAFQDQAEDSLYRLYTKDQGVDRFYSFIKRYPKNRNVENAWKMMYTLYTSDGNPENLVKFRNEYPDYPHIYELVIEYRLAVAKYYPYQKNGKWGYIDDNGILRIDTMYDYVAPFYKGVAVAIYEDKVGYIDKNNEILIPFEYDDGEDYLKSLVVVAKGEYFGIINKGNQTVLPFIYDEIGSLKENLVLVEKDKKFGYVDLEMNLVIPMKYNLAYDFKGPYALVQDSGKFGVIDTNGAIHIPFVYDWLDYFNQNPYCRGKKNGKFGLINQAGDTLLPFEYSHIGETKDSLLLIAKGGKYGYASTRGRIHIEPQYDFTPDALIWGNFVDGYTKFRKNGKAGIINVKGEEIVPALFDDIDAYSKDGLIAVKKRGKWGFSTPELNLVIPYQFQIAKSFQYGTARVRKSGYWALIDEEGNTLTKEKYSELKTICKDVYLARKDGKWGVINAREEELMPFQYNLMNEYDETYLQLIRPEGMQYINRFTGKFMVRNPKLQ